MDDDGGKGRDYGSKNQIYFGLAERGYIFAHAKVDKKRKSTILVCKLYR